jgi:hypothetical protein
VSVRRDATDAAGGIAKLNEFIALLQRAPDDAKARRELPER